MKNQKYKKPKSYSDFTIQDLQDMFGIKDKIDALNLCRKEVEPSEWLLATFAKHKGLPIASEKAKSEMLITPILLDMHERQPSAFSFFSGYTFEVDKNLALTGRCDYLITKEIQSTNIEAPIIGIFEAKDDSLDKWYGQCGAEMYAARLFNERQKEDYPVIFGAVTNGFIWQFLKLERNILQIDSETFAIQNLPKLLGALQSLIDFYGNKNQLSEG
ncbi:MAG: hypothetical protein H7A23_19900 [Leptospiraceae bacterium]|nr:hypothetical protein [Leptospiraceae bacterium]MCP5496821.1 hypothetical protein [Leptospiraceae bacterium]